MEESMSFRDKTAKAKIGGEGGNWKIEKSPDFSTHINFDSAAKLQILRPSLGLEFGVWVRSLRFQGTGSEKLLKTSKRYEK